MIYKINDEEQGMLDYILSGILPHENYKVDIAIDIIKELDTFMRVSDLYGAYYVLWKLIKNIKILDLYRNNFSKVLTRDLVDASIRVSLETLIMKDAFDAERFFGDYGKTFNLEIQSEKKEAMNFTYSMILDKYDELMDMKITSEESKARIQVFKESLKTNIAIMAVSLQGQVLVNGVWYNKKYYNGYQDWVYFSTMISNEINARFGTELLSRRHTPITVNNYEKSMEFDKSNSSDLHQLWYMGFEPIDNNFPIMTHDIFVLVADEGTGKTRFTVDQLYRAIVSGVSCVCICGETDTYKMKKLLESRHIWERYKIQLTMQEIINPSLIKSGDDNSDFEIINMIKESLIDLYENTSYGKLVLIQNIPYEDIEKTLRDLYKTTSFEAVFIDHVAALDTTGHYVNGERLGTMQDKITHLFKVEDMLTKELNIAFFNTSHTNNDTSSAIQKGKSVGVRIGAQSSATTKYASIVTLLSQTVDLKKEDFVLLEFKKIRDHAAITTPIVINRNNANMHEYTDEYQYKASGEDYENEDLAKLY